MSKWVRDTNPGLANECWDREYITPGVFWGATWEWEGRHHWGLHVDSPTPGEDSVGLKGYGGAADSPEAARAACDAAFLRFAAAVKDAAEGVK